jgi:hypothetical protein
VFVQAFLSDYRQRSLLAALRDAAAAIEPSVLEQELRRTVPPKGLQLLQGECIRAEEVFATPTLLKSAPGVLGHYRLLLGMSQKQFYTTKTGLSRFKAMEDRQVVTAAAGELIEDLCQELNEAMTDFLVALPSGGLRVDIEQLPLLTLGAQADGAWRGQIGRDATAAVFQAMISIIADHTDSEPRWTQSSVTVEKSPDRNVTVALAPDPDMVIRETINGQSVYTAAIEIKGGTDYANLHNRAGEAEKSHRKARAQGAQNCWTIISLERADMSRLRQESPTTQEWLDFEQVVEMDGPSWERLVAITVTALGI